MGKRAHMHIEQFEPLIPELARRIQECQDKSDKTYGYRRVWKWLKDRNIKRNPKTVLRIMKKYGLLSEIRRRRKWVNLGQQVHKYENLLKRQFRADRPNTKWVTDISYIHTKEGVLYLSMIRDLYDNSIVAYKTATRQTVNLVLDTIRQAMKKEKKRVAAELQLHSDQGFQYTSQAYFKLTQSYGITPSMSRKEHRPVLYTVLLLGGKLSGHLAEIDARATEMYDLLMKQMAEKEGINEQLKAKDPMAWVGAMNNIRNRVEEIVSAEVIFA